jgi:hypothetical protein
MSHSLNNYIVVDSADRTNARISTPSDYVYKLPTSIRNAATIEILMLQLYRSDTNINSGNCGIYVTIGSNDNVLANMVQTDVASGTDLATSLQTALRTVDNSLTVVYNTTTNALTITASSAFSLRFTSCSTARLLGLYGDGERGIGTVSSALVLGTSTIVSTRAVDISGEPYMLMYVNDYERNIGASSVVQSSFLMIPLEGKVWKQRFVICNDEKDKKGTYYLTGSQGKIDTLRIRFLRPDGSLYNFNGNDHQITFRVVKNNCKDYLA